jgi:hypothetical protein
MHVGGQRVRFRKSLGIMMTERLVVNNSLYVYVLVLWSEIASSVLFNPSTRDKAKTLIDKMQKFETILTATIFNRIFSITTPLSVRLQNRSLDLLQTWRMGQYAIGKLEIIRRQFSNSHMQFSKKAKSKLVFPLKPMLV